MGTSGKRWDKCCTLGQAWCGSAAEALAAAGTLAAAAADLGASPIMLPLPSLSLLLAASSSAKKARSSFAAAKRLPSQAASEADTSSTEMDANSS